MTAFTIRISDLSAELRALPVRDREAMKRAARYTLEVEGPRWIQWSIRGGGAGAAPRATATRAERRMRKKTPQGVGAVLRKAIKKLKVKILGKTSASRAPKRPKRAPSPKRAAPGGYRVPIDTSDYANSWVSEPTSDGAIMYSSPNPPIKAGVIELGRRAGKGIPIAPLEAWVQRKLGVKDPVQAHGIAIAISRHAKKHKREGLHVLGRAHPKIAEAMKRNMVREMKISTAKAARLYTAATRGA